MSQSQRNPASVPEVIESPALVAIFDLPVVYVPDVPDEPMFEALTMKFLDEATRRVDAGDREWLRANGARLFVRLDEAAGVPEAKPNRVA